MGIKFRGIPQNAKKRSFAEFHGIRSIPFTEFRIPLLCYDSLIQFFNLILLIFLQNIFFV